MTAIEQASESDIPELCKLLRILFKQELEFKPDTEAQRKALTIIIKNPETGTILVTRESGKILGMVSLLFTVSTAIGNEVALLEDLVVLPEARGKGIGSNLLSGAIAFAKSKGCRRITLLTDCDNRLARQLYAKHGFSNSSMVPMRLSL
jgi:GNAT superfamily N-acetyltransferase